MTETTQKSRLSCASSPPRLPRSTAASLGLTTISRLSRRQPMPRGWPLSNEQWTFVKTTVLSPRKGVQKW